MDEHTDSPQPELEHGHEIERPHQYESAFTPVPEHETPSRQVSPGADTPKERILHEITAALDNGIIQESDLKAFLTKPAVVQPTTAGTSSPAVPPASPAPKLSAVEIMFYIAGIVLFAALMTMLGQSWNSLNGPLRIFLSFGIGLLLWAVGYVFNRQNDTSDIRAYLENSLVLTGALCVMVGGFIISYELSGAHSGAYNYVSAAITLLLLGVVHFAYDTFVRKDMLVLFGLLLAVSAFPTYLIGLFASEHVQPDVYSLIVILSSGLLVYASRTLANVQPDRQVLKHPFDGLAIFLVLGTMFASMFTSFGLIWTVLLFMSVFGLFYLSIIKRNKQFLGNASFFLIIGVITVAFKYFSGMGVSVSLVIAAIGLLASAAFAASINRKYFKNSPGTDGSVPAQHP